jgi:hypothetical protein
MRKLVAWVPARECRQQRALWPCIGVRTCEVMVQSLGGTGETICAYTHARARIFRRNGTEMRRIKVRPRCEGTESSANSCPRIGLE